MSVADGIGEAALAALGRGFDLANDFRLRFAKGERGRLVELDDKILHDVAIPGGPTIRQVSRDIGCDKGDRMRFQSDILEFNQVCIVILVFLLHLLFYSSDMWVLFCISILKLV